MRRIRALALLAAVALLAGGCSGGSDSSTSVRLISHGEVLVEHPDGSSEVVTDEATLEPGTAVEVLSGAATVTYPGDVAIGLLDAETGSEASRLVVRDRPVLERGEALAEGTLTLDAGTTEVAVADGAARVVRSLSVVTKVYTGTATVTSAGLDLDVPALREAAVAGVGLLPSSPEPLDYEPAHPWDRQFLGSAIELGEQLTARARGFTAQLRPGEGHSPGFFRLLLPGLEDEPGFDADLLAPERAPGETLVGATIAVFGAAHPFADRWQETFDFRDAGAEWGLVALDQGVVEAPLLGSIDAAIGRAPLLALPAPSAPQVIAPPSVGSTPSPEPEPTPPSESEPPPPSETPPEPEPAPEPSPTDPVTGLIDDLLGTSPTVPENPDSPPPGGDQPAEEDPGLLGNLLQGVGEGVGGLLGGLLGG